MDLGAHQAVLDDRELNLTPTEFRILWTLMGKPGVVFSRIQLLQLCVGDNTPSYERTIDVHIKAIRHKLQHRSSRSAKLTERQLFDLMTGSKQH